MATLSTHILDTNLGKPAAGVLITLTQQQDADWLMLGSNNTDADGRVSAFVTDQQPLHPGIYKLTFYLSDYYEALQQPSFYPYIELVFEVLDETQHYHIPLLLSPFAYSTYRGS